MSAVPTEHLMHSRLVECERLVESSLENGYNALRRIHDEKLYKADGYSSFKNYVEQRWGWSKTHAHRLIDYSKIVERLKQDGVDHVPSEGQLRPLTKLKRSSKSEEDFVQKAAGAARIAIDTAPQRDSVPRVTAQHVESTMSHFGIHGRKAKPKEDEAVTELRGLLTKLLHCKAMTKYPDPDDFVEAHGDGAFPNRFTELVAYLVGLAGKVQA